MNLLKNRNFFCSWNCSFNGLPFLTYHPLQFYSLPSSNLEKKYTKVIWETGIGCKVNSCRKVKVVDPGASPLLSTSIKHLETISRFLLGDFIFQIQDLLRFQANGLYQFFLQSALCIGMSQTNSSLGFAAVPLPEGAHSKRADPQRKIP